MNKMNSSINVPGDSAVYRPVFYRLNNQEEEKKLTSLIEKNPHITVYDTITSQLAELIKLSHPQRKLTKEESAQLIAAKISGGQQQYGVWVYYPWAAKVVHLLDEEEFIKVRTNRNIYKVNPEDVGTLRSKKIGIIGLSVGQSIAMTLTMESTCGELRLADFDEIELSNMNRIRVSTHDIGLNKAVVAARQIAELDPFIKVVCYTDGITNENIDDFFLLNGKLDILVEECDGLDIKVLSRIKAKALGVPVVMDTNDKGMLDVERFDLEPERHIFHGTVNELEELSPEELNTKLHDLTGPEKVDILLRIIGAENLSETIMKSFAEMNKTIVGWPQLASAVTLGGAMVTDVSRKILLNQFTDSGKWFVDFDEFFTPRYNKISHISGENATH